jgi:hypothetical protein
MRGSALRLLAIGASAWSLAACVVVPVNPDGSLYQGPVAGMPVVAAPVPPAAPSAVTLPVRLYPTNEAAAAGGMFSGTVVSNLHGKGVFTLNAGGETMTGEATRGAAGSRDGVANAYGARGGFASCQYTMNTNAQGTGRCSFSNGATYQLHIGG